MTVNARHPGPVRSTDATLFRFLLILGGWTVAGQALLASPAVSAAVVVPFSRWQGSLAERYLLGAPLTVSVDATCSGLDVMALCLGATLSYPVAWSRRLSGAAIGVALLLCLNLVRIAMLAGASQSLWFQTLHVDVWPMLLIAATAGWVVLWIRMADRPHEVMSPVARRFALWSALMLAAYVVAVPVLTELQVLDRASRAAAHAAAWVLNSIGVEASVNERVLVARGMHYLVTPDCITTPLIAFYLAAFFASSLSWRARLLGVAAGVPVFAALAVLRLLTVAFPAVVLGTNLILTHGFNQLLAGVVVLLAVALWARGERPPSHAVAMGLFVAVAVAVAGATLGLGYARGWSNLLLALRLPAPPGLTPVAGDGDVQGAMVALPIYQVAIFAASWLLARRLAVPARWAAAGTMLLASQFVFLLLQGWMHAEGFRPLSPLWVRGWAVAIPVLLILAVCRSSEARTSTNPAGAAA
jgi:exosortase/archaeosortase family protein